jgi:hypothetical protein
MAQRIDYIQSALSIEGERHRRCEVLEADVAFAETEEKFARGIEHLYRRGADGKLMLVSDLAFSENGEIAEHKYSRVPLGDEELVKLLEKFKPGDVIGEDLMRRLGEEFMFIRLAHVVAEAAITEEQKKSILREFRQQVSSSAQRGLENELARRRKPRAESELPNPAAAYAGDQHDKKQRHLGPPKFLMYMIYAVIAIGTAMALTILARAFF